MTFLPCDVVMSELSAIAASLTMAAQEVWGDTHDVLFRPQVDLSFGQVCSDLAYDLSEKFRRNPETIGEELLAKVKVPPTARVWCQEGFINVNVSDLIFPEDLFVHAPKEPVVIVVPAPSQELNGWGYLRLLSSALLQALLLKSSVPDLRLLIGELESSLEGDALLELRTLWKGALNLPLTTREKNEEFLASLLETSRSRMYLWLSPHSMERSRFQNLYRRYLQGVKERVLCCPEKRWFNGIEDGGKDPLEVLTQLPDQVVYPMLVHLARSVPACDLDLGIPFFKENANLHSFLHATLQRLARLGGTGWSAMREEELHLEREIAIRSRLLPHLVTQARFRGEIRALLDGLELLLRPINRLINMPSFRARLEQEKMEGEGILSEAAAALGSFSKEYPFSIHH